MSDAGSVEATDALYTARGLGRRSALGTRPALIIVDLVMAFTDPTSPLACETDEAVAASARLLAEFRVQGRPVIFTTVSYDDAGAAAAVTFLDKVPQLAMMRVGSPWVEVDPRLAPVEGEPVISKLFASSFFGTNLATILTSAACDTVVVTGASTSGCVRATVVDAMQHGYRVVVPRQAVADRAVGAHEASLSDMASRYGEVLSLEATMGWLTGCRSGPPA
jgi:maleamate amidohydrolase